MPATRLKDGSYLIFAEEDWKAQVIVYHLQDPYEGGREVKSGRLGPTQEICVMKTSTLFLGAILIFQSISLAGDLAGYELLVATFRTGDTEIFIVDPDTGDARNLTRSPKSKERYPAWSPDGKQVAFNSDRDGTFNLYVIGVDGKDLLQLTHEKKGVEAGMQSWTADGKWIYFGLFGKGEPRMCRIAPDGSKFAEVGKGIDPAISPDGKMIAFARALSDGHHLYVMDADGANVRQLTGKGNTFAGVHCTWTPDSKTIIYADQVREALELFRIDADGKNACQLTKLGKAATTPAVSPDMKWISFRLCDEVYWRDSKASDGPISDPSGSWASMVLIRT
jgi:TolB protein